MELSEKNLYTGNTAQPDKEIQARLAQELLYLEMDHWHKTKTLIHPHILALIHQWRELLRQPAKGEAELLFRSALAAGYGISEWGERAWRAGVPVDAISMEELNCDNFRIRAGAVLALESLGNLQKKDGQFIGPIIKMLVDDYPQVRAAAICALERLQPEGKWRKHLVYECYVPAGEFVMGDDGIDLRGKKVPAHHVFVEAFYIGKYPVTNADYKRYVDDVGHEFELQEEKPFYPVVDVSWHHARNYAAWAEMRLLTEAEWEKAASWIPVAGWVKDTDDHWTQTHSIKERWLRFMERWVQRGQGSKKAEAKESKVTDRRKLVYPWGNMPDPNRCNSRDARFDQTTPVGMYSPGGDSPYGCADMVGNVWEWTSSLYKDYDYQADDGREEVSLSGYRVVRGGSYLSYQGVARTAGRFGLPPHFFNLYRGFRVGLSPNRGLS